MPHKINELFICAMSMDYVDAFNKLDKTLNDSIGRIDELFKNDWPKSRYFMKGLFPTPNTKSVDKKTDVDSMVDRAETIKNQHEKDQQDNLWKNEFFVTIGTEKKGPFGIKQLLNMVVTGEINKETQVWTKGMKQWSKAKHLRLLQNAFKQLPPPVVPNPPEAFDYQQVPAVANPPEHPFIRRIQQERLEIVQKMIIDSIKRQIQA